jgi:hypothetical protein
MMNEQFHEALERLDIPLLRKIWLHVRPNMPHAASDEEALVVAHMTRTQVPSIRFKLRAYSHAWLIERGLPSQLPDKLRPKAERIYPVIIPAVGIATRNNHEVARAIRRAMVEAVLDAGIHDPILTKRAILAARAKTRSKLLGIKE